MWIIYCSLHFQAPYSDATWLSGSHPEVHKARHFRRGYWGAGGRCACCPRRVREKATVLCVLFVELIERMTYYSIGGNMVLFATNVLLYSSTQAVTIHLIFSGKYQTVTCLFHS